MAFAVDEPQSFADVTTWLNSIREHADPNVVKVLVGNKCDLVEERRVSKEDALALAKQNGMQYYDASAKTNQNIDVFMDSMMK